jgi:hypothetical protein
MTIYTNGYTIEFGKALLRLFGAPDTPDNHNFLAAWSGAEGGHATNNPFNSGEWAPGATVYNPYVKNYVSLTSGLEATYQNLSSVVYDYSGIITALQHGNSAMAAAIAVSRTPWGTGQGVVNLLVGDGNVLPEPLFGLPIGIAAGIPRLPLPGSDGASVPAWCHTVASYHVAAPLPPSPVTGLAVDPIPGQGGAWEVTWTVGKNVTHWNLSANYNGFTQHHTVQANHGRLYGVAPNQALTVTVTPANATLFGTPSTTTVKT